MKEERMSDVPAHLPAKGYCCGVQSNTSVIRSCLEDVDQASLDSVEKSEKKTFLVGRCRPDGHRFGICTMSDSWLGYCGFSRESATGRLGIFSLLQGPLTSKEHIKIMQEYFRNSLDNLKADSKLVIPDLVNYRFVKGRDGKMSRRPFKFKLTVQPFHSVVTGQPYPIFEGFLENAQDLDFEVANFAIGAAP